MKLVLNMYAEPCYHCGQRVVQPGRGTLRKVKTVGVQAGKAYLARHPMNRAKVAWLCDNPGMRQLPKILSVSPTDAVNLTVQTNPIP